MLAPWQASAHTCYEARLAAEEAARFEDELAAYLESPQGRFDLFYAARTRDG